MKFKKILSSIMRQKSGLSLVEVLLALVIFTGTFMAITGLVIDAGKTMRQGSERTKAIMLAKEGLEAARSIRDDDFDNLTIGTHGIALAGNTWTFSGASDTQDQFTRTVAVSTPIVTGIETVDIAQIDSTVTWAISPVRNGTITLTDYLTDWAQTEGDAEPFILDLTNMEIGVGAGNKSVKDHTIENTGGSTITLDKMTTWWDNANKLRQIRIDGSNLYGPVNEASAQVSGTEIDIANLAMASGSGAMNVDVMGFTGDMTGTNLTTKFIFTDGSTHYAFLQEPDVGPSGGEAVDLTVDTSGVGLDPGDNTKVTGITIENTGTGDITIDTITTSWTDAPGGTKWNEVTIDGVSKWTGNGNTGQEQDIADFVLSPGSTYSINSFDFDKDMTGTTLDITFTMGDSSTNSVTGIQP
jgi:Tfp pilus assembly protein PilV